MKNKLLLFLGAIFFCACQSNTSSDQKESKPKSDEKIETDLKNTIGTNEATASNESETKKLAAIFIEDKSQYSAQFISKIRSYGGIDRVDLKGDLVILDQRDSIQFPQIPKVNKRYTLTGKEGDLAIAITVKRINYTTIEYKIEMNEFGKSIKSEMGLADLSPFFFLGSESDIDDQTKESYFCTEFSGGHDSCHLSIRIGNIEDSPERALLAKLIKNCNDKIRDIDLDNFPTLREK